MESGTITAERLARQRLARPTAGTAEEIVSLLGAVQAQDYPAAKWGIALRSTGLSDADVEQAFTDGSLLRTHILRPTWHFVTPADIRWMLMLSGPRVDAANGSMYRKLELDEALLRQSNAALEKGLEGGRQLTRQELAGLFESAGIASPGGQRLAYMVMHAELRGVICSGPRRGAQFTYALLEERVPKAVPIERDEALLALTLRYFSTRGPATPHDMAMWSGLTLADVRRGIEIAGSLLESRNIEDRIFWFTPAPSVAITPGAYLLPNYDEYFIGFKDRSAIGERIRRSGATIAPQALSHHIVIVDGQIVGGWRRTLEANRVTVELNPVVAWTKPEERAVSSAAEKYGAFLGLPVTLATSDGFGRSPGSLPIHSLFDVTTR